MRYGASPQGAEAIAFGATLHIALTLASAGSVTSVSLARERKISAERARRRLQQYAQQGYLVRTIEGNGHAVSVYAITVAGRERLELLAGERTFAASGFAALIEAIGHGLTGSVAPPVLEDS